MTTLAERTLALWAARQGVEEQVLSGDGADLPLADRLVVGEHIPLETLMAVLDPAVSVRCTDCRDEGELGVGLLSLLPDVRCPRCGGVVESADAAADHGLPDATLPGAGEPLDSEPVGSEPVDSAEIFAASLRRWALEEGVATSELDRLERSGTPLFDALVTEGVLGLEQLMGVLDPMAPISCDACGETFQLGRGLHPFAAGLPCPTCEAPLAAARPARDAARAAPDVTVAAAAEVGPAADDEATAALLEQALCLWAVEAQQVPLEDVMAAGEMGLPLSDALVLNEHVSLEAMMGVLDPRASVVCSDCKTVYKLGVVLTKGFLPELCCALCEGALEPREATPAPLSEDSLEETFLKIEAEEDDASNTILSARVLGPYTVLGSLGKGGMGEVYLATDSEGQRLALKLLRRALIPGERAIKRFHREGRALEGLAHENLVQFRGQGVDPATRRPYLAMEYVEGTDVLSLARHRPEARLEIDEACFIIQKCSRGLAALHDHGVIHRDIKPSNVLLGRAGEVKLTDLGVALAEDVSVRLTALGQVLGTPQYVAPEVVRENSWTPAADVYALGVMAYRILTGRAPFPGKSVIEVLNAQVEFVPPPITDARPEVPQALSSLVEQMLAKDPIERPTIAELQTKLDRCGLVPRQERVQQLWKEELADDKTLAPGMRTIDKTMQRGQVFQNYLLEDELGRGGMGVVYRAQHTRLKKTVALKMLLSGQLASEEEQRRFLREAEAVAALNHPYIVPVLDAGDHEGTYFLTMDYVAGEPLGAWYKREGRDLSETLRVFVKICEGIHHAHTRGIIHRDLKPDNVLIDEAGDPHILDFGIAKKADTEDQAAGALTTEGDIIGTLRYMPPEQAGGRSHEVDVRSDVYALGSILYELVTGGTTPFQGTVHELIRQIVLEEPRAPSYAASEVPWELDAVCLKSLEKKPDDRYQSAIALKADIDRFLAGQPILARQASFGYQLKKWLARNRRGLAAAAVVLVMMSLTFAAWRRQAHLEQLSRRAAVVSKIQDGLTAWDRNPAEASGQLEAALELMNLLDEPELAVLTLPPEVAIPQGLGETLSRVSLPRLQTWVDKAKEAAKNAAALAAERQSQERFRGHMADAKRHLLAGKYEDAARALEKARLIKEDHAAVVALNRQLAGTFLALGRQELKAYIETFADRSDKTRFEARTTRLEAIHQRFSAARELGHDDPAVRKRIDAQIDAVNARKREVLADENRVKRQETAVAALARARAQLDRRFIDPAQARSTLQNVVRDQLLIQEALVNAPELDGVLEALVVTDARLTGLSLAADQLPLARQELKNARGWLARLTQLRAQDPDVRRLESELKALETKLAAREAELSAFAAHVKKAEQHFAAGDYAAALRSYDLALAQPPADEGRVRTARLQRDLSAYLADAEQRRAQGNLRAERSARRKALSLTLEIGQDARRLRARIDQLDDVLYRETLARANAAYAAAYKSRRGWARIIALFEEALRYRAQGAEAKRGRADAFAERDRPEGMILVTIPLRLLATGAAAGRVDPAAARRFYIDRVEVSNQAFAVFATKGGYRQRSLWSAAGWRAREAYVDGTGKAGPAGWSEGRPKAGTARLPVTGVSSHEAAAYARFIQRRLPSEEEWVLAAAFDPQTRTHRRFPWGSSLPESRAGLARFHAVGSSPFDVSPWGVLDMGFNASEWVTAASGRHMVRGLSARFFSHDLEPGVLNWSKRPEPEYRSLSLGFRCAQDVKPPPALPKAEED